MNELLAGHVRPFDEPADWADVLRRAHRRPRRRLLVLVAAIVAAFVVAPALAVLLHDRGVHLPAAADRQNVVAVLEPRTGRILAEVAPWKGHNGFCYLAFQARAGCVPRSKQTVITSPPLFGWSFDPRVRAGTATTVDGRSVPLLVLHLGGRVDATVILIRDRLPRKLSSVLLRDAAGHAVGRRVRLTP